MPRLNGVLMGVLAAAVIGTAVFLSLEPSAPPAGPDPAHVEKLLRKLADSDPDVRREGEAGFRALGAGATGPLVEASRSQDRRLAALAARLLREVEPAKAASPDAVRPEAAPAVPGDGHPVELTVTCGRTRIAAGEPVRFYVRLANHGSAPVLVARNGFSLARFAWIEVEDGSGAVTKASPEPVTAPLDRLDLDLVALAPGESRDLYAGIGDGSTGLASLPGKGSFRIRFVYDAAPDGAYRKLVGASELGTLLPPMRLVSNALEIAVAE